ncbi:MAG: 2-amino-4-hydroxy-6-hydroxymethyldihydropteridine diphosphokinase [Desulforhopalus sp.]
MTAYIGLGSNLGDSKDTLLKSWQELGDTRGVILDGISSPYMTAPVDMTSHHWFTNAVGRLQVAIGPLDLLKVLLSLEEAHGRVRKEGGFGYQDRSLDLDLLYYGEVTMDNPELTLPHPRIGDRLFVLVPFAELDPDFIDPVSGETIRTLEQRLRKRLAEKKFREQEIVRGRWEE